MSAAEDDRIYGLIVAAEEQQRVVEAALARLAAQEEAIGHERTLIAETITSLNAHTRDLRAAAQSVAPQLEAGTREAIRTAIAENLRDAGAIVTDSLTHATQPAIMRIGLVDDAARKAEAAMRGVAAWASWRLLGKAAAGFVILAVLLFLAPFAVWWWDERAVSETRAEKARLERDIQAMRQTAAEMQDTVDQLAKRGGRATLTECGETRRLCIRVDDSAGVWGMPGGKTYDLRVIKGY